MTRESHSMIRSRGRGAPAHCWGNSFSFFYGCRLPQQRLPLTIFYGWLNRQHHFWALKPRINAILLRKYIKTKTGFVNFRRIFSTTLYTIFYISFVIVSQISKFNKNLHETLAFSVSRAQTEWSTNKNKIMTRNDKAKVKYYFIGLRRTARLNSDW